MRVKIDDAVIDIKRRGKDTVACVITDRYGEVDIRMTREEAAWLGTCLQAEASKVDLTSTDVV